jgi:midasin, putative
MSNDTISMDQLNVDNVSIDLTNNAAPSVTTTVIDLTNMQDQGSMEEQQPIPLNQPIRRKPTARKSIDELQVMSVEDLDAMVPKKEEAGPKGGVEKMKEDAMSALEKAIKRKTDEYVDFAEAAIRDDKLNREYIREGLEEAPVSELKYQVQDLPGSVTKDPNAPEVVETKEEKENDDIERELELADIESDVKVEEAAPRVKEVVNATDALGLDDEDDDFSLEDLTIKPRVVSTPVSAPEPEEELPVEDDDDDFLDDVLEEDEKSDKEKRLKEAEAYVEENNAEESVADVSKGMKVSAKIDIPDSDTSTGKASTVTSSDFDISDDDIDSDIDGEPTVESEDELTDEQIEAISKKAFKELRSEIIKKVVNASRKMDLTTLSISNKVVNVRDALKAIKTSTDTTVRTAVYPMMYANRNFMASSLKGPDVAMLVEADDARIENNPNILLTREQARVLYDHDANPFKPATVESWAKTIPYGDVESIFAAIYLASLKNANYIPRQCPNTRCQHSFLTDTLNIDSIIDFPSEEVKKKFNEIRNSELTKEASETYESSVSVINDRFAIGLKAPSIFTILYEYTALDNTFASKYSTMLYIMQYIDYLYYIDEESGQLSRIAWKQYPGDYGKTFKSKIATYAKILKEFDEADFTFILALVRSMETKNTESTVRYYIPETKCSKCGTTIEKEEVSPRQLVFTRQRLVALATTPVEK